MKIAEAIDRVDKSSKNQRYVDIYALAEIFDIHSNFPHPDDNHITAYWISQYRDGDTHIGMCAYFLDGLCVAVSRQTGRKSDEVFKWRCRSSYNATKKYVLSLLEEDEFEELDMDTEIDEGCRLTFASQLLSDTVIYNGERRTVNRKWKEPNDKYRISHKVMLEGDSEPVLLSDCVVPYNVSQEE